MAAPTEYYVDPSIAADSGSGTIGAPWGDLQYALNQITRNATDGDRINILAGTDEILAAALSLVSYGTPEGSAPLIFQGYTSAAGDGGIGGIDCANSYAIIADYVTGYTFWIDLHIHNSNTNTLALGGGTMVVNCEFNDIQGNALQFDGGTNTVINCQFHDISGNGIYINGFTTVIINCSFRNDGTRDFSQAVRISAVGVLVMNSVFDLDGASTGIYVESSGTYGYRLINNSIYSAAGTGHGIDLLLGFGMCVVVNNVVEGFSGTSGVGIAVTSGIEALIVGHNALYNNETNQQYSNFGIIYDDLTANDPTLSASPFIDAANDDFRIKPSVKWLAYPTTNYPDQTIRTYLDIGAFQRKEWGLVHPGYSGGLQ